ncbi:hypothetical protein N7535_009511 [Penicillium sp. DV-2018c]|nr:hypothetical protein N7461_001991 [Penicillium sp. DV-2018c]KAJ5559283.1 hypothetical protein N7535_009511 [Penicillium sp. DV-2018c]
MLSGLTPPPRLATPPPAATPNPNVSLDDESHDDLVLEDEEEQLSPEYYYLREAESLGVSQLRQRRYSAKTQEALDEAQDLSDRFCKGIMRDPVKCLRLLSDTEETVRFLTFSSVLQVHRGRTGIFAFLSVQPTVSEMRTRMYFDDAA